MFTQSWQGRGNNRQVRDMNGCKIYERAAVRTGRWLPRGRRIAKAPPLARCTAETSVAEDNGIGREVDLLQHGPTGSQRRAKGAASHEEGYCACEAKPNQLQDRRGTQAKGEVARQEVQGSELRAANGATAEGEEERGSTSKAAQQGHSADSGGVAGQ